MDTKQHTQLQQHLQQQHLQQQQLIQAVKDSDVGLVVELLRRGVSADSRDVDGRSLLYWACCRGHADICRRLLRRGCDVTVKGKAGTTALMACADNGHETCLQLLLQHRSILLDDPSDRGDTALHMSAFRGFPAIVQLLCMAGANLSLHNDNGHSPLHVAFIEDNQECVDILNKHGQKSTSGILWSPNNGHDKESGHSLPSRFSPSPASNGHSCRSSPSSLQAESCDVTSNAPSVPRDHSYNDHRFVSSDSALDVPAFNRPSSSQSASHYPQCGEQEVTSCVSDVPDSHSHTSFYNNFNTAMSSRPLSIASSSSSCLSTNSGQTFTSHLHSPEEVDERPFFNHPSTPNDPNPQSNGNHHADSGHFSNGLSGYHSDAITKQNNLYGLESSGYYSSGTKEKKDPVQTSNTFNGNFFERPLSPNIDPIYPPSFAFATSVEDISGPPAICYSPAVEHDHVRSIYSNAIHNNIPSSVVVSSSNKRKAPINNLSSQSKRNEDLVKDVTQYNIVSSKPYVTQNYTPNISPTETAFKNKEVTTNEPVVHQIKTDETEVLPGLKMSSFLESLQVKVVMLEESLEKANASNDELQSDNKQLREENMDLRAVVQRLTQKLSELS